ncbi:MAG: hypothetical protein JWL90_341 [Chthoniobacteraceae bacterium]|nr:hypothetical protein [Chthoniobacteraceae bacterium]
MVNNRHFKLRNDNVESCNAGVVLNNRGFGLRNDEAKSSNTGVVLINCDSEPLNERAKSRNGDAAFNNGDSRLRNGPFSVPYEAVSAGIPGDAKTAETAAGSGRSAISMNDSVLSSKVTRRWIRPSSS